MYASVVKSIFSTEKKRILIVDIEGSCTWTVDPKESIIRVAEDTLLVHCKSTNKSVWIDCKAIKSIFAEEGQDESKEQMES